MKKIVSIITVLLLLILCACGGTTPAETPEAEPAAWSRSGLFMDENDNMLTVTWWENEGQEGWYVGCMLGEEMYGDIIPQEGSVLHGNIVPEGEEGSFIVTVSEEGDKGLLLEVEGGETYHFTFVETKPASIFVTVNTEGMGYISCVEEGQEPADGDDFRYTSTQLGLDEPATYVLSASPVEGWTFVKWMKDGSDLSTDLQITVELTEDAEFTAVFDSDESGDGQNPVMNFIGSYVSGRAGALIEPEGTDSARITIEWGSSAWELGRWVMSGRFDQDSMSVAYSNCVMTNVTYNEDGSVDSETTEYEDGTGRIIFGEDLTFTWHDDQSDREDMIFEWSPTADGIDYLALVNKLNPLPDGWEDALETVTITNSVGDDVEVEIRAYEAYLALKEDLEQNDGIYIELDSARRSIAAQQDIMNRFIEKYGADYAAKTVAQPGYSEHHTGLALDLYFRIKGENGEFTDVYYNEDMEKEEYESVWDTIHSKLADYGFILRYLRGKEHITGYRYEPWHIRYLDDADIAEEIMSQAGMTLEEYLAGKAAPEVTIDLGNSALYTQEELTDAMLAVKCRFASLPGCELHTIRYAGDEACSAENLKWLNSIDEGADYTQLAEFLMDFHSPDSDSDTLEDDTEYTDREWWLARTDEGDWNIVTWGW